MGLHMVVYVLKMWKMQNFQNLHFEHMENVCYIFQVPPSKVVGIKKQKPHTSMWGKTIVWRQQLLKTMFCDLTHIHETP